MKSFSRGMPGVGLLLIRLAVAIDIVAIASQPSTAGWSQALPFTSVLLGFALLCGFLTWFSACLAALVIALSVLVLHNTASIAASVPASIPVATAVLLCIAVALAGPGGYSLDALLWGPRRITYLK